MDPSQAGWGDIMNMRSPMYQDAVPQRPTLKETLTNPRSRSDFLLRMGANILGADPSRGWGSAVGQGVAGTVNTLDKLASEDMSARQKAQSLAAQIKKHAESLGEVRAHRQLTFGETQRHHKATEEIQRERLAQDNWKHIGYTVDGAPIMMNTKTMETINAATKQPLSPEDKMALSVRGGAGTGQTMQIIAELRKENPSLSFAEAHAIVKKSGPSPDMLNIRREALALSAAKADMDYLTKPEATIEKYRRKYGASAPAVAPAPTTSSGSPLDAARAAIAAGANRDAVIKRLIDNGIDPSGL